MTFRSWEDIQAEHPMTPEERAEQEVLKEELMRKVYAFQLRSLREELELTQTAMAEILGVSQNSISKMERGEVIRMQLDTLQRYVKALGGELEVRANFGVVSYRIA